MIDTSEKSQSNLGARQGVIRHIRLDIADQPFGLIGRRLGPAASFILNLDMKRLALQDDDCVDFATLSFPASIDRVLAIFNEIQCEDY